MGGKRKSKSLDFFTCFYVANLPSLFPTVGVSMGIRWNFNNFYLLFAFKFSRVSKVNSDVSALI